MFNKLKEKYRDIGRDDGLWITMIFVTMALKNDIKAQKSLVEGLEKLKETNPLSKKELDMMIKVHKEFANKQQGENK